MSLTTTNPFTGNQVFDLTGIDFVTAKVTAEDDDGDHSQYFVIARPGFGERYTFVGPYGEAYSGTELIYVPAFRKLYLFDREQDLVLTVKVVEVLVLEN